jgi:metalloendopeptidase OMA1, mitochondrial
MTTVRPKPPPISSDSPIAPDSDSLASEDDRYADTRSLSASVTDYPTHWGRRYHRYREGSYLYPNDDPEAERLDDQHDILNSYFDGQLFFCPIDPDSCRRILDIGTGTGIWPIELAESGKLPQAEITGIDLSPIQPEMVPENVTFEIQDCSDTDWSRPADHLDLIHARFMAGSLTSYRNLIRTSRRYLKPGDGWLELHELHTQPQCDDGTMPKDWKFTEWEEKVHFASKSKIRPARPVRVAQHLQHWMEECGYVDVSQLIFKIPLGPWPRDKKLKAIGQRFGNNWIAGLPGFSYKLFGGDGLGWSRDEIELKLVDVRKSLAMKDVHAYLRYYVVIGRRPSRDEEREIRERRRRGEED